VARALIAVIAVIAQMVPVSTACDCAREVGAAVS